MRYGISCPVTGDWLTSGFDKRAAGPCLVSCPACDEKHLWIPLASELVRIRGLGTALEALVGATVSEEAART